MATAGDLFDQDDLDIVKEGETVEEDEQPIQDGNADDADDENSKKVKAKRIIRNPQPRLNPETLKGPRGLCTLESYFDRVKFKGRGREEEDLSVILKTYEYWCHRLFPKFQFDDCIAKIETLGSKKAVKNYVNRIRMGLEGDNEPVNNSEDSDHDIRNDTAENDEERQPDLFDTLVESTREVQIDADMEERIRLNREKAEKIRQERLKKIQAVAQSSLMESSQLPSPAVNQNDFPPESEELVPIETYTAKPSTFDNNDMEDLLNQIESTNDVISEQTAHATDDQEEEADIDTLLDTINDNGGCEGSHSPQRLSKPVENPDEANMDVSNKDSN